jgi:hypothetical protein
MRDASARRSSQIRKSSSASGTLSGVGISIHPRAEPGKTALHDRRSENATRTIGLLLCAGLALAMPTPEARAQSDTQSEKGSSANAIDLIGAWHVTVHYRDEASANPDADRWDDKVWSFEKRGSRMQWTEFPIVVFENREGRFETSAEARPMRTLHFWEPNAEQTAQIARGLLVNPRGAKSKGLRGSASRGFRSVGGLRSESASVIGYSESWSIEGLGSKPVFTQDVVMGSGRTEDMQGRTRYAGEAVNEDRLEVRGSFVRDGTRHGTFVLRRAGEIIVMGGGRGSTKGSTRGGARGSDKGGP